jgi:glycosyltransferase involved in cell wall biosynthesis
MLSCYPPTLCGQARFGSGLATGLSTHGAEVSVVRIADGSVSESSRVVAELVKGSAPSRAACIDVLNHNDVAVIQHSDEIDRGPDAEDVVEIIGALQVPSIVIAHSVPKSPTRQQRSGLEAMAGVADRVVVMSAAASKRLRENYQVARHKIAVIPHGATVPKDVARARRGRPTLVTWGLLAPGKGIERVIDAMRSLKDLPGRPLYVVAGRNHPNAAPADAQAYREALVEQAQRLGVADVVCFEDGYRNGAMLSGLAQSAAVVVLPYDSADQVTSGVLVDAIANGRPVVATAFPHACELLATGAGMVVDHDDPNALVSALRRVLTEPRFSGALAAEARRLAPELAWPVVADAYLQLAHRTKVERRAAV